MTQARAVLQRVLDGRITFLPDGDGYRFSAQTRFDRLFAGIVAPRPSFVPNSAEGTEHIGSADTHDLDYGLLLERAYGKGLASPTTPVRTASCPGCEPSTSSGVQLEQTHWSFSVLSSASR